MWAILYAINSTGRLKEEKESWAFWDKATTPQQRTSHDVEKCISAQMHSVLGPYFFSSHGSEISSYLKELKVSAKNLVSVLKVLQTEKVTWDWFGGLFNYLN